MATQKYIWLLENINSYSKIYTATQIQTNMATQIGKTDTTMKNMYSGRGQKYMSAFHKYTLYGYCARYLESQRSFNEIPSLEGRREN